MAPLPSLTRESLLAQLRHARLGATPWRFGSPHPTHAVVHEGGRFRLHVLSLTQARIDEFKRTHGRFMPEDAGEISEPGRVLADTESVEALCSAVAGLSWPLPT